MRHLVAALLVLAFAPSAFGGTPEPRILVCGWGSSNVVEYDAGTGAAGGAMVPTGGGSLTQAHSIRIGPDGALYLTSTGNHRVLRYNAFTGQFLGIVASGAPMSSPTDAVFGPDGDLYVASFNTGTVLRYDAESGAFLGVFATGAGAGRVEMLAWGPDGHLYATTGEGNSIARFNGRTGAPMGDFITPGLGGLDDPHGFVFGPDGHLYVSSFDSPLVIKYHGTTGVVMPEFAVVNDPGTPQDETGGLASPHGLRFGPDGHLYVASFGTSSVKRFDGATGAFIDTFAAGGGLSQPTDLVFTVPGDADGDGVVNVDDLVSVIVHWGTCPLGQPCPGDVNGDGTVNVDDLVTVVVGWTAAP